MVAALPNGLICVCLVVALSPIIAALILLSFSETVSSLYSGEVIMLHEAWVYLCVGH